MIVTDENGKYQDLKHALYYPEKMAEEKSIQDFVEVSLSVSEDQMLDTVMTLFCETGFNRLHVIDTDEMLKGSVIISDLIRQYNIEVENRNIAVELGAVVYAKDHTGIFHLGGNTIIIEIPVPLWAAGKTIGELELQRKYKVLVFLVKENGKGKEPRW